MDQKYSLIAFHETGDAIIELTKKLYLFQDQEYVPLVELQPNLQLNTICFVKLHGKWKIGSIKQFAGIITFCAFSKQVRYDKLFIIIIIISS